MDWILERLGLMRISDHTERLFNLLNEVEDRFIDELQHEYRSCNRCDSLRSDLKIQKAVNERLQREVIYWKNECNVARGK